MLEAKIKSDLFYRINDHDVVSLCCVAILQLVLLGLEDRRKNANVTRWQPIYANEQEEDDDHNSYSLMGFAWAFKGRRPTSTLSPNKFKARSDWALKELMQKDVAPKQMYNKMNNFMEQTPMPSHPATPNWQNPMPQPGYVPWSSQYGSSYHRDVGLVNSNLMNREMREACPSIYLQSPFTGLPPTTVLSKKRGDKSRNKGTNPDVAPFNLKNAIIDDNVVVEEVMITGACQTDDYIVYENVDPSKRELVPNLYIGGYHELGDPNTEGWFSVDQMNAWIELLIRERPHDARWRVEKSRATSLHPRSNQFIIQTDPHIIRTLDGSTSPYPSWNDVDWVYMPINAGGDHWVTGAVNLSNFRFYVFDSLHSEVRRSTLYEHIRNWTNVVNVIFQSRGCFQGTGRQPYNFQVIYNDGLGCPVRQQANFKDCGVITCWLISKLCACEEPRVNGER
ncbi:phospholipase-like protein [Tanacetum coccineum]